MAQGSGLGLILCAVSVDIGSDNEKRRKGKDLPKEHTYKYKGKVEVESLCMVDDVAHIHECGHKSIEDNVRLVAKFEHDKLELNKKKCHKIHIGNNEQWCPKIKAHESDIERVADEKYIGDYIMENGKHTKTIKSRVSKCIGLIAEITSMLKILCLGKFHF